jgi:hypothetical protein
VVRSRNTMHFEDLTPYDYLAPYPGATVLNVGWLGYDQDIPTAHVPGLAEMLAAFVPWRVDMTAGLHPCVFCGAEFPTVVVKGAVLPLSLGSAEIRVQGNDGVWYGCPEMIVHYVGTHDYRPPDEFIAAVFNGPAPNTQEYADALLRLGMKRPLRDMGYGRSRRRPDPVMNCQRGAQFYRLLDPARDWVEP